MNDTKTIFFRLEEDVLIVCNNGEPFSIEGIESLMLPCYTSKSEREFKRSFKAALINDQVDELLDERRAEYLSRPQRIQSDYNNEHFTVGEYHGREILELLQNCIDAMPGSDTFQIGAKGLGFRSLLNWCEKIKIHSGELSVAFGLEEAAKFRESLGLKQKVAILSAPTVIDPLDLKYTTQITLYLKKSVIDDVKAQLMQIDERSMVFLPKIEELHIKTDDSERSYQKLDDPDGNVLVSATIDGINRDYLWRVFKQEKRTVVFDDIDNEEKEYSYSISIAFCEDIGGIKNNYLYSYFKTKVEFPIGWLCHADFELRSDRNDIIDHPLNKLILRELVSLIDASSENITNSVRKPGNALLSIVPSGAFPAEIAGFKFSEYYHANIGRGKVLPTTNGNYIAFAESPWLVSGTFPALFTGEAFNNLLKISENKRVIDFVRMIAARDNVKIELTLHDIQYAINKMSANWSPDECFVVFEWWRKTFGLKTEALTYLPNLIKLENGNWANGSDRIYFKVGRVPDVPAWVRFSFLRSDFQEAAISYYNKKEDYLEQKAQRTEQRDERNIPDYAMISNATFFRYLDRNTAIAQVNISVGDDWNHAKEFIQWLYEYYGDNLDWTPPSEVGYNFPSQNEAVCRPDALYFGEHYNNELAIILSMQENHNEFFNFPIPLDEQEKFVGFFAKFGVRYTPVREQASYRGWQVSKDYREALISNFLYPLQLDGGTVIADESAMRSEGELILLNVDSYKNLDDILENSTTSDLLSWITKDGFLKNSLMAKYETTIAYPLTAKRKGQINGRSVHRNNIRNYIAHVFTFAKWIQIGERRYSPNQIILDEKIGEQFEPRLIGRSIDSIFAGLSIEEYELNAIINNLGFISDFSKIQPSFLYAILNELSENDADLNGDLSRKIYLQIMRASGLKDPDASCAERVKFLRTGRVYCFDGDFHRIHDVRYADKSFPERVRANQLLINLHKNQGAKKAETWFGIKEFKPDIIVSDFRTSSNNRQFEKDLHELLKGLYVENHHSITDEKRWRAVKSMRIILASSVTLAFGETRQPCEVYQYAKNNDGQYILMLGNEKPDKFDERLTNALFEIVKTVINIDSPAFGSSFRDLWKFPSEKLRAALIQRNDDDENVWNDADFFFDGIVMPTASDDVEIKNMRLFKKCRDDNLEKFKRILYAKLLVATTDEQKTYLFEIEKYKQIEPAQELIQDDYCDVLSLLLSITPANHLLDEDNEINVDEIGIETKQKLIDEFSQNVDELNSFLVREYDSLLRFGNFELLKNEFEMYLEKRKNAETAATPSASSPKSPVVVDSSKLRLSPVSASKSRDGSPRGGTTYTDYSARQTQNTETGKSAERIVYDHLFGIYGESKTKWVSQFAKEENKNLDGADGAGYDIEYIDGEEKHYVEVKTNRGSLPSISFELTAFEHNFAEANSNYQIYVVTAPNSDSPTIIPFSWNDIQAFADTPTGYLIEFKQKEVNS